MLLYMGVRRRQSSCYSSRRAATHEKERIESMPLDLPV